jgi:hypothetical protein
LKFTEDGATEKPETTEKRRKNPYIAAKREPQVAEEAVSY